VRKSQPQTRANLRRPAPAGSSRVSLARIGSGTCAHAGAGPFLQPAQTVATERDPRSRAPAHHPLAARCHGAYAEVRSAAVLRRTGGVHPIPPLRSPAPWARAGSAIRVAPDQRVARVRACDWPGRGRQPPQTPHARHDHTTRECFCLPCGHTCHNALILRANDISDTCDTSRRRRARSPQEPSRQVRIAPLGRARGCRRRAHP
jgi:hypothetical protein